MTKTRAKVPELGADLVSLRGVEVGQDRESLFPERASLPECSGGVAGVAEMAEGVAHAPAAAGRAMQVHCLQVAGSGFGLLAGLLVGIPEAVERAGLSF